jgi:succinate-acetate transporter protein
MSTVAPVDRTGNGSVAADDLRAWRSQTRVFLQPIAAPSILGLFGFAGATFMVAANMAGWFGNAESGIYIFPFAATFGGLAQFVAGLWSYRARDGIATAMHGMWGAFWLAYGILWGLRAVGDLTIPSGAFPAFGYWFLVLAAITACGAIAAAFENLGLFAVLTTLAVGAAFAAIHFLTGVDGWKEAGGWVLLVSSWLAIYTAAAMMLEGAAGRVLLPLGHLNKRANTPGRQEHLPLEFELGEPGVRHGQ